MKGNFGFCLWICFMFNISTLRRTCKFLIEFITGFFNLIGLMYCYVANNVVFFFLHSFLFFFPNKEGGRYTNENCSEQCVCEEDFLNCNNTCDTKAECRAKNGVRKCYCNIGYEGDGKTCTALPKDCYEAYLAGHRKNGVYTILPQGWPGSPFDVSCDMNRGGWTVS